MQSTLTLLHSQPAKGIISAELCNAIIMPGDLIGVRPVVQVLGDAHSSGVCSSRPQEQLLCPPPVLLSSVSGNICVESGTEHSSQLTGPPG